MDERAGDGVASSAPGGATGLSLNGLGAFINITGQWQSYPWSQERGL